MMIAQGDRDRDSGGEYWGGYAYAALQGPGLRKRVFQKTPQPEAKRLGRLSKRISMHTRQAKCRLPENFLRGALRYALTRGAF